MTDEFELQILLPVHNEEGCIADTIQEIYAEISPPGSDAIYYL